ncbi:hypothetical protein SUDANB37_05716 [Streptomyces sp. enrichment culture]
MAEPIAAQELTPKAQIRLPDPAQAFQLGIGRAELGLVSSRIRWTVTGAVSAGLRC